MPERPYWYGLLAEFEDPTALLEATRRTRAEGYRRIDAFSPFPVEGLAEAVNPKPMWLPLIVLVGGMVGGLTGYFMQWYSAVIDYPWNIGGRPYHSWPAFVPITFELTVLFAAVTAVLGMLALNGLPMPYHPCFNVERFAQVTRNRFFLLIESRDPNFELERARTFLQGLNAKTVTEVPW